MSERFTEDWMTEDLDKFLISLPKSRHPSSISDKNGYYNFYVCSSDVQRSFECDITEPAVLISTGGEAAIHYATGKYSYSTDVWATKYSKNLTNEFVFRFLDLNLNTINSLGFQGSGIKHLDKDYIKKLTISYPSLQEQKKIASILTSVDKVIEKTQLQINKLQDLKKGTINELLTKGIGHTEFKDSELGRIPRSWKLKTILELNNNRKLTVQTGPFGSQLHARDYVKKGVPLILIRNITSNGLNMKNIPRISPEDAERLNKYQVKLNDIVFSRVGRVGSCFLVTEAQVGWIISGQTLRIRIENNQVDSNYLHIALEGDTVRDQIINDSVGSTRTSINTNILENTKIPVPNLNEQITISRIYESLKSSIENLSNKNQKIKDLKQSLMQDLLTGKVRVTVN